MNFLYLHRKVIINTQCNYIFFHISCSLGWFNDINIHCQSWFTYWRSGYPIHQEVLVPICHHVSNSTGSSCFSGWCGLASLTSCKWLSGEHVVSSSRINIHPFYTNVPFLYPLNTSENQKFSEVFRGYRK